MSEVSGHIRVELFMLLDISASLAISIPCHTLPFCHVNYVFTFVLLNIPLNPLSFSLCRAVLTIVSCDHLSLRDELCWIMVYCTMQF